ncbi:late exocytosis, associated with Golgi transport-domain-containing protein, partial [Amylocarpus encephaloides]
MSIPVPQFKHVSGIDNYFFDRYLHTVTKIFSLLLVVVSPVLMPLNMVDGRNEVGGVRGLDRLSFSNVSPSHTDRYWAHLVIAIFVIASVCQILRLELRDYTRVQDNLGASELRVPRASSLLLTSKSKQQLSIESVRRHFHNIAGGVHTISINRDYSQLHAKLRQRDLLAKRLEVAETNLIVKATSKRTPSRREGDR